MPKTIHLDAKAEMAKDRMYMLHMLEMEFSNTTIYVTDSPFPVTYASNTYLPLGDFLGFTNISETSQLQVGSVTITFSGVNTSSVGQALNNDFIDRRVVITRAFLDVNYALVNDPYVLFTGRNTGFKLEEDIDSSTSTLTWNAASILSDFNRTAGRRTNQNDQEVYFPGDLGFEFADQAITDLEWGK